MFRAAALSLLAVLAVLLPVAPGLAAVPVDTMVTDWSRVEQYRMVPGDQLRLHFDPLPAGPQFRDVRVRPDGRISVFPIGDVIAAGRTPAELQDVLTQLLAAEYREPRITVELVDLAGNQVHVIGRVVRPGSFPVTPNVTLLQAVAQAGGFEDDAARNSVLVFHRNGSNNVAVRRVKVDRLLRGEADVLLSRYDIVYVPRSTIGNIDVFVRQFFGEPSAVLNFALVGWELFNLDRVFVVPGPR